MLPTEEALPTSARENIALSKKRAEDVDYVIAVADGRVVGIYRPKNWSASKEVPGKFEFEGRKNT